MRLRERLAGRLEALPVEVADVDRGPGEVLIVAQRGTDDVRLAVSAGVRWIQSLGVGVESVLIPEVVERDIVVTNTAGASAGPVAELAFARILEHAKGLRRAAAQQEEHSFEPFVNAGLEGEALCVVGLGAIGQRVAQLGKAFGMHVVGIRHRPALGPAGCDAVFGPDELATVVRGHRYLVGAAAQTAASEGLVGRDVLAAMAPGGLVVNVGRPGLVDHQALMEAARAGQVAAALDVLPEEPLPAGDELWTTPGIAISPHIGVLTPRVLDTIVDLVVDNVGRYLDGRPLRNVVDKVLGYVA
jgi:phosphoglycerate dehydrogenase-like enzyme